MGISGEEGVNFRWRSLETRRPETGIALRDSQTARINANNWILPAISVSLERRAAQLRNAPRRRLRRRRWIGSWANKAAKTGEGRSVHPIRAKVCLTFPSLTASLPLPIDLRIPFQNPHLLHLPPPPCLGPDLSLSLFSSLTFDLVIYSAQIVMSSSDIWIPTLLGLVDLTYLIICEILIRSVAGKQMQAGRQICLFFSDEKCGDFIHEPGRIQFEIGLFLKKEKKNSIETVIKKFEKVSLVVVRYLLVKIKFFFSCFDRFDRGAAFEMSRGELTLMVY